MARSTMFPLFGFVFLLAGAVFARVMDHVASVPEGWAHHRTAEPDEGIFLRVALKPQPGRAQALDQAVLDLSTPGHANYGMHMTRDELRSYTVPSDDAVSAVTEWLRQHDIHPHVDHDWVFFTTTVRTANELLDTRFAWYQYVAGRGPPSLRALSYSVPDHIATHIDLVQPTTRFGKLAGRRSTIFEMHPLPAKVSAVPPKTKAGWTAGSDVSAACNEGVTPDCLRSLYKIYYTPTNGTENKAAFASFLEEYARYDDLKVFEERFVPDAVGTTFTVEEINGGDNDQQSGADSSEANLDVQYLLALSYPIPLVEYSTGGRAPLVPTANQPSPPGSNEPYLEFLLHLASQPDAALPQTISVSYGEEEQAVPREYALKVCDMFRDLGARGVSVLFASGDSGPGRSCISNTGGNATFFESMFPGACPWVTSVGGTANALPERAAEFSSGGFSIYHARPAWQEAAVGKYLAGINDTYAAYFNRSGRGFPDVAALASQYTVYDQRVWASIMGTSASCPVVAGMVALLNAARREQGKPPMGFLNPWLYNNSAAFTDITLGAGEGCAGRAEEGFGGYMAKWNATPGWDPVTGLGTPLFDRLLEAAAPGTKNGRDSMY